MSDVRGEPRLDAKVIADQDDRFRILADHVPVVVYTATLGEQSRLLYVGPGVQALLGIAAPEFDFTKLRSLVHPEDQAWVLAAMDAADAAEADLHIEYKILREDGRIVWVEDRSSVVVHRGETVAQGYLLDITERKATEALLEDRARQRRLVAALGSAALAGADATSTIAETLVLVCSGAGADYVSYVESVPGRGLVVRDARGWPESIVGAPVPDDSPAGAVFRSREPAYASDAAEGSLRHRHGVLSSLVVPVAFEQTVYGVLTAHALRESAFDDDALHHMQLLANVVAALLHRDRTEAARQTLETQLRQAQKLQAVGQLTGGIAHDFNNLLTVINGYASLLTKSQLDEVLIREASSQIERSGAQAARLTGQLLAFSRQQALQPELAVLGEIVEEYRLFLTHVLGEGIGLELDLDPATPLVVADRTYLGQVLMNLAVNARDAMPEGGTLTIRAAPSRGGATLTVTDTGVGMDPETLERAFEPFFTTKEAGKGTGLGLATVHGTIEQSGGTITLSSRPGEGTRVTIVLPAAPDQTPPAAPERIETAGQGTPAATPSVLVVDDNDAVRTLVARILTADGMRVSEARSRREALAALQDASFDLLLTDVVLGDGRGTELALEAGRLQPGLRVLHMSGYPQETLEPGIAFIQKPFAAATLIRTARGLLT